MERICRNGNVLFCTNSVMIDDREEKSRKFQKEMEELNYF